MATETKRELVEIKCPFESVSKGGHIYPCPGVIVKVYSGSQGEAWCRRHKKSFEFSVDSQNNYKPSVTVQQS